MEPARRSGNATFGSARLNTTVNPSAPSGVSIEMTCAMAAKQEHRVAGSLRRSKCRTTAPALSGVPSWNLTPSWSVIGILGEVVVALDATSEERLDLTVDIGHERVVDAEGDRHLRGLGYLTRRQRVHLSLQTEDDLAA